MPCPVPALWLENLMQQKLVAKYYVGRVNGPILSKAKIWTGSFQVQYLLQFYPIEPYDHDQTIHGVPVNGLMLILKFCGWNWSRSSTWKLAVCILALFTIMLFILPTVHPAH